MSEKGKLSKALLYAPENGFDRLPEGEKAAMHDYCESYKDFLNHGKTERLCVEYCIELAKQHGFVEFQPGMALKTGDKVYCNNRGKGIMLAVIGKEPLSEGANIAAAHTDAPRLDLKPRPLYEEAEMAYFKTHHYGGIRKYQWVTIPLELHGVVTLSDGTVLPVHIGDKPEDPQFIINDLLPHLGREQGKKPLNEAIPSESLNILVGSQPVEDEDEKSRFKLAVMQLLHEKYGMVEEPSWRLFPPGRHGISALTAASSPATATTTGYAPTRSWRACSTRWSPSAPPCASSPTRRRSAARACPACCPPPLTSSWASCATPRACCCGTASPSPSASAPT